MGISLCFTQAKSKKIFYKLLNRREEIEDKIDYLIGKWDINKNKITTEIR